MFKKLLIFFLFFIPFCFANAQGNADQVFSGCGTDLLLRNNSSLSEVQKSLNTKAYEFLKVSGQNRSGLRTMTHFIPVVVHIIHNGGPENISDPQVFAAISNFNTMFQESDSTRIQFCLAARDPFGNPTNGITRDVSVLTNETMEIDDIALKNINRWPPTCYLNIWVVAGINSLSSGSAVIGYAYLPSAHGLPMDGVVIEAGFFGVSATTDAVGAHEIGHYLGLYHTFENACSNNNCQLEGDLVCDTPPDQTTFSSCAPNANSCNTDADDPSVNNPFSTDVADLGEDYMDYSSFSCYTLFTPGQYTRMNYFLTNVRGSLLNCLSCASPCPAPVTATITSPVSTTTITTGGSVSFSGTYVNATGQQWYLSPSTILSTAATYVHTFPSQGIYWMKYRALSPDPTLCLNAIDSVQIIVLEPVSTSCEGSLEFTNENASVYLPPTNEIYSSNGFTWECWVKLTAPFGTDFRPMITAVDGIVFEDMALAFGWTGGVGNVPVTSLAFKVDGPAGPSPNTCNYMPPGGFVLGTWYHVAGTMDYTTSTGKLYLDGVLVDTKSITSTPFSRIIPAQLNWDVALTPGYPNDPLGGNLDEIRIWKRVRTDAEIAAYHDSCLTGNETDLLIYYRANQTAGTTCLDATPFLNHGTLTAPTYWSTQQASIITTNCANLCNSFCPVLLAGADTTICNGSSAQLDVSGGFTNYSWSPGAGLSDSTISNPVATPLVTTTYTVTGTSIDSNLFINPDFALGNFGFVSGQTFSSTYAYCNYNVTTTFFTLPTYYPDHTPTSDNMFMCVDGCDLGPRVVWEQLVPAITSNTDYEFQFYATRSGGYTPVFEIHAIGDVTGDVLLSTQPGIPYTTTWTWDPYGIPVWNSGANTSVTFRVINLETNGYGNDFAMDDFSFRRICTSTDTVTVSVGSTSPVLELGNDTVICGSGVFILDAGPGFSQYTWQNGSTNQTYTAFGAGLYWVTVVDACAGTLTDTISITTSPEPVVNIISDTVICEGDSIMLSHTGGTFTSFNWEPGNVLTCSTCGSPSAAPVSAITYTLVASTSGGCTAMDSIEIMVYPSPSHVLDVFTTDELCGDGSGSVQFSVSDNTYSPYLFDFNNGGYSSVTTYTGLTDGYYSIVVRDINTCVFDTVVQISDSGSPEEFFIANCFSPNGDGSNDHWFIPANCGEKISCRILNRWGIEVALISEDQSWNGKVRDAEDAADGVYYYIADVEFSSGEKKTFTGFINLLR